MTPPEPRYSPDAEYVTQNGHEIKLARTDTNLWYCYFNRGGEMPEVLKGTFLTKRDIHQVIVRYLSNNNVLGTAKWPK